MSFWEFFTRFERYRPSNVYAISPDGGEGVNDLRMDRDLPPAVQRATLF